MVFIQIVIDYWYNVSVSYLGYTIFMYVQFKIANKHIRLVSQNEYMYIVKYRAWNFHWIILET